MDWNAFDKQFQQVSNKKLTEKEKRIKSQLKVGGSFTDPITGLSTADSLNAGGGLLPERFREVDPSRIIRTDKKARAGELYLKSKGDPSNLSDEEKAFLYKYDSTFFIKYKPKEEPKLTQKQKDAEKKKKKIEDTRLKNEADPVGHISGIDGKIDDAKKLRRKTKEGSTERAQYDNIINTLTSEKDSIRNANPKFNLKSLVNNLNIAVNTSDTTKVETPKPTKVYKTWRNAKSQIKGEERRKVTFFANAYMNDTEFIAESKKTGTNINELAWKQALKDNNIQFNK